MTLISCRRDKITKSFNLKLQCIKGCSSYDPVVVNCYNRGNTGPLSVKVI